MVTADGTEKTQDGVAVEHTPTVIVRDCDGATAPTKVRLVLAVAGLIVPYRLAAPVTKTVAPLAAVTVVNTSTPDPENVNNREMVPEFTMSEPPALQSQGTHTIELSGGCDSAI
jgi:hypothetical protein